MTVVSITTSIVRLRGYFSCRFFRLACETSFSDGRLVLRNFILGRSTRRSGYPSLMRAGKAFRPNRVSNRFSKTSSALLGFGVDRRDGLSTFSASRAPISVSQASRMGASARRRHRGPPARVRHPAPRTDPLLSCRHTNIVESRWFPRPPDGASSPAWVPVSLPCWSAAVPPRHTVHGSMTAHSSLTTLPL